MGSHALKHEPLDAYNLALTENLHPAGWINPTPADRYNLVVIGAGTAGVGGGAGGGNPWGEGCAGGARPDGRRLPELRMRAVEGADSIGARGGVGARRGPLRGRGA